MGEGEASQEKKIMQEKLIKFMETEVESLHAPATSPYIYKVSKELRQGHTKVFEPISISIGPLHYDDKSPAQEFKKWYLKNFIDRLKDAGVDKHKLAEVMSGLEKLIRECYRDINEQLPGDKLVQIMLLDGCFIIDLLLSQESKDSNDSLVGRSEKVSVHTLQQDLLKIENQIPFFVLETLADLTRTSQDPSPSPAQGNTKPAESNKQKLISLALDFFGVESKDIAIDNPRHLLELALKALFHENKDPSSAQPSRTIQVSHESSLSEAKSASELEMYGIQFQAGDRKNLTKVEFKNGVLTIPPLVIQESTESMFWNFLIFEMSSCSSRIFTSYVVLMDTLINNDKDVELLLRSKILVSRLNDIKSLVSLFNGLSATVNQKDFYFEPLIQQLNRYCRSGWRPQRAYLVQNYYDASSLSLPPPVAASPQYRPRLRQPNPRLPSPPVPPFVVLNSYSFPHFILSLIAAITALPTASFGEPPIIISLLYFHSNSRIPIQPLQPTHLATAAAHPTQG
ncbi:hypothetical protein Salat_0068900 [Sesamum alatum]|uniref:Uncharacterized protein n=1 Tax=Sesamum alatum TaxID=300844 RepID=A0AAE1YVI9_9LAMI|nr:hypothetical protein Salat_0068900 [Sesamum alatum]